MSEQRSPTRDQIISLRRRIETVTFGRQLLERKKDALIRAIEEDRRRLKDVHRRMEEACSGISFSYALVRLFEGQSIMRLLMGGSAPAGVHVVNHTLMGCRYQQFRLSEQDADSFGRSFVDPALASLHVDDLLEALEDVRALVWTYINLNSKLNALEKELKKTTLKVNTLEHTVLPSLAGDLRRIISVLAERERQERFAVKRLSNRKKAANVARKRASS